MKPEHGAHCCIVHSHEMWRESRKAGASFPVGCSCKCPPTQSFLPPFFWPSGSSSNHVAATLLFTLSLGVAAAVPGEPAGRPEQAAVQDATTS